MIAVKILGVKIDKVDLQEATEIVDGWLSEKRETTKRVIVTPNVEFILKAQTDPEFRQILNSADLSIPDSSHLGWANQMENSNNLLARLFLLPLFLLPNSFFNLSSSEKSSTRFPKATGVDLMENLSKLAAEKGYSLGLLGGQGNTATKAAALLKKKYPGLNIRFAQSGGEVDEDGKLTEGLKIPALDILFVAFGHSKQEKWIENYKDQVPSKVFMGVGGSFDYISGIVARAPKIIQSLGLEWLFRLIMEPWRIKRQSRLLKFIGLVFIHKS